MRHDELLHYGVKGMLWRKGKKAQITPSGQPRGRKFLELPNNQGRKTGFSGTGSGKKITTTSNAAKANRTKFNEEAKSTIENKKEEVRKQREEEARKAAEAALEAAKNRAKTTTTKQVKNTEPKKQSYSLKSKGYNHIIFSNSTSKDYYRDERGKLRRK